MAGAADGGTSGVSDGGAGNTSSDGSAGEAWDVQGGAGASSSPECGNDLAELGEECDGSDLRDADCLDRGFTGGVLGCDENCAIDESGCTSTPLCDYASVSGIGRVFEGNTADHVSRIRDHSCTLGGAGEDLSLTWTAPETGCFRMEVSSANDLDTILSVYETCSLSEELACDDNSGFDQFSLLEFDAVGGTSYAIVIDSYFATDSGPVNLDVSSC
jgi:hypothetical protein